jgi:KRAB domain-containing zinc finger protein
MENPSKKIKLEPKNDFETQQENFLTDQKVKKDPEGNFLFLSFESPKMPKLIKREVTRKEIKRVKSSKFSEFQCKICQRYLCDKVNLDRHTERHFQPSSFECKRCEKIFKAKGYFKTHKCVKKSERHFCPFCEKNFSLGVSLSAHVKQFHPEKLKVDLFNCDFCNEKFFQKGNLKFHLESFKCRTQKNFTCDHCGKEFKEKSKIRRHVKSNANFKVECNAQVRLKSLSVHKTLVHKQNEKFECKITKNVFKNSQILKVHFEMKFYCKFCIRKFSNRAKLNQHLKFHENPEQFKCQICGHQSTTKSSLKTHLKNHDKNRNYNFKCNQCNYRTDSKKHLINHLKVHEKFRNYANAVKCEHCPSVLKTKASYKDHLRRQHGTREKFQCDVCDSQYLSKISIKKHLFKHIKV